MKNSQKIYLLFKRLFDIVFSLIAILVFSPIFFVIAILVLIDTKGFPIFRQKRIGKNNKEFLILKFRSMNVNTPKDVPTHLLENPDQYISRFGKWIRKSSIDELPQLFNIFIGQMSFIGPRPALWSQSDLISERNNNDVSIIRPGLTGYAQVYGKYNTSALDKLKLDMIYITNYSLVLDFQIIFETVKILFQKESTEGFDEKTAMEIHRAGEPN